VHLLCCFTNRTKLHGAKFKINSCDVLNDERRKISRKLKGLNSLGHKQLHSSPFPVLGYGMKYEPPRFKPLADNTVSFGKQFLTSASIATSRS
jgi:hypothetical protein